MGNGREIVRSVLRSAGIRIVLICCAAFCAAEARATPVISEYSAMRYLSQYGYLPSVNSTSERIMTKETMSEAIAEFQSFMGIDVTGTLNVETAHLMSLPRCGVKDKNELSANGRSKRYAFMGSKWFTNKLTYRITKYTRSLDRTIVDNEIAKAFAVWSEHTDLSFSPVRSGPVHIEISFERGYHGHPDTFDGRFGILAHAFAPDNVHGSTVHFDDDEHWVIDNSGGMNLFQIAVHEFGHVLGLSHSSVRPAIMFATYEYRDHFRLHTDDIRGIQELYGLKTQTNNHRPVPVPRPGKKYPQCKNFPIVFTSPWAQGTTELVTEWPHKYILHWKTTPYGMAPGYPQLQTTDDWNNIKFHFKWNNGRAIVTMCRKTVYGIVPDWENGWQNL